MGHTKSQVASDGNGESYSLVSNFKKDQRFFLFLSTHCFHVRCNRVRSVAYNMVHDQLILSSSSDTLVNLHSAVSVSSASYMGQAFDEDDESVSSMDEPRE